MFNWVEQREDLRKSLAKLINAKTEEIGLSANTTSGIVHIAHLIPWPKGAKFLCFRGEFPTNVTPWKQAAERCNGEVVWVNLKEMSQNPLDALTK